MNLNFFYNERFKDYNENKVYCLFFKKKVGNLIVVEPWRNLRMQSSAQQKDLWRFNK